MAILWGDPIIKGELDILRSYEQNIIFPNKTTKKYIKFLVTDAVSLDGKSIASIGKLDVITSLKKDSSTSKISIASRSKKELKEVIRKFAEIAFSSKISEQELLPYYSVTLNDFKERGDFVKAAKVGIKSIIRFLDHTNFPPFAW